MKTSLREPPESSHFAFKGGGVVKTKMCNGKINDVAHTSHNFSQNGPCEGPCVSHGLFLSV